MAVVKSIESPKLDLRGYNKDPMFQVADEFVNAARSIKQESGYDIYSNPGEFFRSPEGKQEMKRMFIEQSFDENDTTMSNEDKQDAINNMDALFENDTASILTEATTLGAYNPVIGMALPMHKNILMNAVFDQVLPKDVSRSPKFTLTMEKRIIVDTQGHEYDIFAEQNMIKPSIENSIPTADFVFTATSGVLNGEVKPAACARTGATLNGNIVHDAFSETAVSDLVLKNSNLSIKTYVSQIIVKGKATEGESLVYDEMTKEFRTATATDAGNASVNLVFAIDGKFTPGYGANDRILNKRLLLQVPSSATETIKVSLNLMGTESEGNKMMIMSSPAMNADTNVAIVADAVGSVYGVTVHAVVDVSTAAFPTVKAKWTTTTDFFEIPEAPHITVPISPEEVKDINALYDTNQVTKLMSMMRLFLLHWKDDSIHDDLDQSFLTMPDTSKVSGAFDFAPPLNYNNNPVEWRRVMFMDNLDQYVTRMLNVLNDENMTVAVFGRPELIKRIAPQQFTYQTPTNIGPVELDFKRTVVTSEHRVYNFVSSQKMRNNNNLIVMLVPRNSMRITYKIIDYQMYISNEIRDTEQYQLPSMTCFERWLFLQYQPVQGRIRILNPSGLRENVALNSENDYIGTNAMNDFTANTEQYSSEVNGVIDTDKDSATVGHVKIPAKLNDKP